MLGIALTLNNRQVRRHDLPATACSRMWRWLRAGCLLALSLSLGATLTSCREQAVASPRSVAIDQTWELSLGHMVEGFRVVAGLGDVSMHVRGARVRAPFDGEVELAADGPDCIFFTSPEVPAYLFRFCGIRNPNAGKVVAGDSMGRANYLHFATMRRQPEGTWAVVEPSTNVLERSLERY